MPEIHYSRTEIKTILDDAIFEWVQPYTKEQDQRIPVSQAETVGILISSLKDRFGIVEECCEPFR